MERLILPDSKIFENFILENGFVHTDPRYNVGDMKHVLDVVLYPDDLSNEGDLKRLLLIESGKESCAEYFWDVLADSGKNYVLPVKHDSGSPDIAMYEIPVSVRPLEVETKNFMKEPQNKMDNDRIAHSLGLMMRTFADATGFFVPPEIIQSRASIVDFVDTETEPTLMIPPINYEKSEKTITEYYSVLFEYDFSSSKPFIIGLNGGK